MSNKPSKRQKSNVSVSVSAAGGEKPTGVGEAPRAPSAELESALRAAEVERECIRDERQAAERCEHWRSTTLRLLQGVATYATPGGGATWISHGQSIELTNERLGLNANWRDVNEEFCRDWSSVWLESARAVREGGYVEVVRGTKPRDDVASVAKLLYMRLLDAPDIEADLTIVVADLAAARARLVERRFALQYFFEDARTAVAKQVSRERQTEKQVSTEAASRSEASGRAGRKRTDAELDDLVRPFMAPARGKRQSSAEIAKQIDVGLREVQQARNRIRAESSRKVRARRPVRKS